jgi:hypothetical protein
MMMVRDQREESHRKKLVVWVVKLQNEQSPCEETVILEIVRPYLQQWLSASSPLLLVLAAPLVWPSGPP